MKRSVGLIASRFFAPPPLDNLANICTYFGRERWRAGDAAAPPRPPAAPAPPPKKTSTLLLQTSFARLTFAIFQHRVLSHTEWTDFS